MVVIAVTGKPGAGSSTIARKLAEKLDIEYFSPGQKFFKSIDHDDDTTEALKFWKTEEGSNKWLHEKIDHYQRELAKKGDVVICGKLSIWVLHDIADLKVWLDCGFSERIRRTSLRDRISLEEARRKLGEREEIENREWKKMYGFDRDKQRQMADLIIDTTNKNPDQIVQEVLTSL